MNRDSHHQVSQETKKDLKKKNVSKLVAEKWIDNAKFGSMFEHS
jgi:hypothetical protein